MYLQYLLNLYPAFLPKAANNQLKHQLKHTKIQIKNNKNAIKM